MINVTKTYLPPFEEYTRILKRAWDKAWITNNGELVQELEQRLKEYLGVKHLFFTTNGTVVLQMALKACGVTGEVITTPFSYVATTNSILWEGCKPVFVDINRRDFCIDADKIEQAITGNTQAILATHVYGLPCDVEMIEKIAARYQLKVIYDGAHSFGCRYKDRSLLSYGDVSTCSFHATKVFHTVEGGCIITNNDEMARKIMLYRQFGHVHDDYFDIGINAKNSEFHAAMGLCVFEKLPLIIGERKAITEAYNKGLKDAGLGQPSKNSDELQYNYSYYPVVFNTEKELLTVMKILAENGVNTRRYFYPSLNNLPYLDKQACQLSEDISARVLCLPLYAGLEMADVERITGLIVQVLEQQPVE